MIGRTITGEWLAKQVAELIAGNARIEARLEDVLPTVKDHEDRIRRGERDHATNAEVEATVKPITGQTERFMEWPHHD